LRDFAGTLQTDNIGSPDEFNPGRPMELNGSNASEMDQKMDWGFSMAFPASALAFEERS
jgi:hypothetical protein